MTRRWIGMRMARMAGEWRAAWLRYVCRGIGEGSGKLLERGRLKAKREL